MSWIGSENFEFCLKRDMEIRELCLKQGQGLNARAAPPTKASVEYPPRDTTSLTNSNLSKKEQCSYLNKRTTKMESVSGDYIMFKKPARERQQGVQCDGCLHWNHRTCNTGN